MHPAVYLQLLEYLTFCVPNMGLDIPVSLQILCHEKETVIEEEKTLLQKLWWQVGFMDWEPTFQ